MITKLRLYDWKSYQESELHIDPLSVLVGTNASGKSNALDALQFLYRIAAGSTLTTALQGDSLQPPLRGGIDWAPRKPGYKFTLGVDVGGDETTDYEYSISCAVYSNKCDLVSEQLVRKKYRTDKLGKKKSVSGRIKLYTTDDVVEESPTIVARLYNEKRGTPRQLGRSNAIIYQIVSQKNRQEIQEGVSRVIDSLKSIFILDPIPSHMRGYSALSDSLKEDAGNIAGVLAALPAEKKKDIEGTISKYVSKLPEKEIKRVYSETVGKFDRDAMLYCEENWISGERSPIVDARGMSDGTLRFLAILTALLTRPSQSLLVIEEVDNGLHPSRSKLLIEILSRIGSERQVDVLITTHNPALLDAMGAEMVPFITVAHRDPDTGNSLLTLLEDIDLLPKLLSQGSVGQLSSRGVIEAAVNNRV